MRDDIIMPPEACPGCGYVMDRACNPLGDRTPRPGDVTMCIACGDILRIGPGLSLLAMTPLEEIVVRMEHPELARIERAREQVIRKRGRLSKK